MTSVTYDELREADAIVDNGRFKAWLEISPNLTPRSHWHWAVNVKSATTGETRTFDCKSYSSLPGCLWGVLTDGIFQLKKTLTLIENDG